MQHLEMNEGNNSMTVKHIRTNTNITIIYQNIKTSLIIIALSTTFPITRPRTSINVSSSQSKHLFHFLSIPISISTIQRSLNCNIHSRKFFNGHSPFA